MMIAPQRLALLATATLLACTARAEEAAPDPAFTAHIDIATSYILRGASTTYGNGAPLGNVGADAPESKRAALQWGADLAWASGWSIGYWASMINYSYKQLGNSYSDRAIVDFQKDKSIENDLYGAYSGTLGEVGYTAGLTGYAYLNGKAANAFETKLGASYGEFSVAAQTLLNDVVWGNRGDTYWTAVYATKLPLDLGFSATLGAYTYQKEGKYLGSVDTLTGTACGAGAAFVVNGCFAGKTPIGSGFRHLTLALSGTIPSTALAWSAQAIIGGETRYGVHQKSKLVGVLTYGF
jgi:uncharacterized protein (TIGR02001 family)